jgi:hypothetical protein
MGKSKWMKLKTGVPQGTIAGPTTWKVFMWSLMDALVGFTDVLRLLYADDVALCKEVANAAEAVEFVAETERRLTGWCADTNMILSPSKTKVMVFGPSGDGLKEVKDKLATISPWDTVSSFKFLGITITSEQGGVSVEDHAQRVIGQLKKRLYGIKKLSRAWFSPSSAQLRVAHMALLDSCARYGLGGWGPYVAPQTKRALEEVLAKSAAIVAGVPKLACRACVFSELGLARFDQMIYLENAILYARAVMAPVDDPLRKVIADEHDSKWVASGSAALAELEINTQDLNARSCLTRNDISLAKHIDSGRIRIVDYYSDQTELRNIGDRYDIRAHCDGATCSGKLMKGAAAYVIDSPRADLLRTGAEALGHNRDSFICEQASCLLAMVDLDGVCVQGKRIAIFTDGLNVLKELKNEKKTPNARTQFLRKWMHKLAEAGNEVHLYWAPKVSHGEHGRAADAHAKYAAKTSAGDEHTAHSLGEAKRAFGNQAETRRVQDLTELAEPTRRPGLKGKKPSSTAIHLRNVLGQEGKHWPMNPLMCGAAPPAAAKRQTERLYQRMRLNLHLHSCLGITGTGVHENQTWIPKIYCPLCLARDGATVELDAHHLVDQCFREGGTKRRLELGRMQKDPHGYLQTLTRLCEEWTGRLDDLAAEEPDFATELRNGSQQAGADDGEDENEIAHRAAAADEALNRHIDALLRDLKPLGAAEKRRGKRGSGKSKKQRQQAALLSQGGNSEEAQQPVW